MMTSLAIGDAVTFVPDTAIGGGWGLFDRKSGWINSCIEEANAGVSGLLLPPDVGLEKFGGLEGGDEYC